MNLGMVGMEKRAIKIGEYGEIGRNKVIKSLFFVLWAVGNPWKVLS